MSAGKAWPPDPSYTGPCTITEDRLVGPKMLSMAAALGLQAAFWLALGFYLGRL